MKVILSIIISIFLVQISYGQKKKNLVKPIDTVQFRDRQVVLFNNGTWLYVPKKLGVNFDVHSTDTMKVFKEYWSNTLLFPYAKSHRGTGDTILTIADSLHKFVHPNPNPIIGEYKQRRGHFHGAWDIGLLPGTPVKAAFDGKVRIAEYNRGGFGYLVIIRHYNGLETYYSHLSKIEVSVNEIVKAGDIIGLGGNTGRASAFHLHFEIRYFDRTINPHELIDPKTYSLKTEKLLIKRSKSNDFVAPLIEDDEQLDSSKQLASKPKEVVAKTTPKKETGNKKYHTVKGGDTLSAISRKYGISVKKLCELNGIKETAILSLGKKIRVQ